MNGTQQTQDVAAQQPLQPATANANGSSTAAKKRKKEGLKPIITTDTPPGEGCPVFGPMASIWMIYGVPRFKGPSNSILSQTGMANTQHRTFFPCRCGGADYGDQNGGERNPARPVSDCRAQRVSTAAVQFSPVQHFGTAASPEPRAQDRAEQIVPLPGIWNYLGSAARWSAFEGASVPRQRRRGSVTRLGGGLIRCCCRTQADGEISVLARAGKTRANEGCPSTDFTGRQLSSSCQDLGMNTYDAPCSARATDVLMYGRRRWRDGWYRGLILSPDDLLGALLILGAGVGGPDFASPDHSFSFPTLFSSSHLLRVGPPAPPSSLSSFLRHHRPGRLAATLLCAAVRFCKSPYGVAQRHLILRCGALHCGALPLAGWLAARNTTRRKARQRTPPCLDLRIPDTLLWASGTALLARAC
ncbi:hypothetical protein CPLU01_13953 [Colletotrichum plurivorum]|uniref:Uncharacterized protein n=1 Tax=Colletotrichum plurivorum TaxID=2175906 RepID=A0A8H6JNH0_9PEZI|nr:hypothetical protein CPLU01_13953 [Colletotrichum plurivorum]